MRIAITTLLGVALTFLLAFTPFSLAAQSEPDPGGGTAVLTPIPYIHRVQEGETLTFIATSYGVSIGEILTANDLSEDAFLSIGQPLIIPGREGTPVETAYVVAAGDSLAGVATNFNTTIPDVVQANRLINPRQPLLIGQTISVTSRTGSTAPIPPTGRPYVVSPGETLLMIAARHGLSLADLLAENGLATAVVFPGQRLRLPADTVYRALPGDWVDVQLRPLPIRQGSTLSIYVENLQDGLPTGQLAGQNLRFTPMGQGFVALVGLDAFTEPQIYELELTGSGSRPWSPFRQRLPVLSANYGTQYITIPEELSGLLAPEIRQNEDAYLDTIYTRFNETQLWEGVFQVPVTTSIVTAPYGDGRSYNGGPIDIFHTGIDFAGGIGTPILAPANGIVLLAEDLELRGLSVILDHGLGVMTAYFHLSEIFVTEGETVTAGQAVGAGGNTGLSSGPHLHWDVRVRGTAVDGMQWTTTPFP